MSYFCTSIWCLRDAGKSELNTKGVQIDNPVSHNGSSVKFCPKCQLALRYKKPSRASSSSRHTRVREQSMLERRR